MIVQGVCVSFLLELGQGIHALSTDTLKMALFNSSASLSPTGTTAYSDTNEITGTGYSAGGRTLSGVTWSLIDNIACLDASDVEWSGATFIARAALVYNSSKSNRAIGVIDFGAEKSALGNTFRVKFPPPLSEKAFFRLTTFRG